MPLTKSAIKAQRVSERKRKTNLKIKKNLKEKIKKANQSSLSEVYSVIDKAVKKKIIHKNKAARIKSSLTRKLNKKIDTKKVISKKSNKKTVSKKTPKKSTKIKK